MCMINFLELVNKYKEEAIKTLQELVQINSVLDYDTVGENAPFGKGISEALNYMLNKASKDGFKTFNDDGYVGVVTMEGNTNEKIGILGHLDVVPVGEGWTYPSFSAQIVDGKMYGRGTMDDKGPTIASYIALKILKENNIKLNKTIELILGTDEETGWRGIEHYTKNYELPSVGFSPDAEFPLIHGEKGIVRVVMKGLPTEGFTLKGGNIFNAVIGKAVATTDIDYSEEFNQYLNENNLTGNVEIKNGLFEYTIVGKSAHAMEPHKGINAGTHLANFLNQFYNHPTLKFISNAVHNDHNMLKLGQKTTHKIMGIITNNVGIMDFNESESKFTFDIRYPIGFSFDYFSLALPNILGVYDITCEFVEHKTPHYIDIEDNLVKTLYNVYVKYTNDTVNKPCTIGGGTYARALKHGVAFGMELPGEPSVVHQADEYLDIENFLKAIAIYAEAIYELGK